jgi:hypothetical protein
MRWVEDQNTSERNRNFRRYSRLRQIGPDAFAVHQLGNNICAMRIENIVMQVRIRHVKTLFLYPYSKEPGKRD